jgi:hypothetical protein
MKAAELGMKAGLILDGCMGWWDRLQQTHTPFKEMKDQAVLEGHHHLLTNHQPTLVAGIEALEKLVPSKPDLRKLTLETQVNTEYPFFYLQSGGVNSPPVGGLTGPSDYFTERDSLGHYRTAHELLTAYRVLFPRIHAWKLRLPAPL